MRWLLGIFINAVLFVALAGWFHGFHVSGFGAALVASLILSILNMLVRPILIILTLPITILTLGLFLIVINAMTLLLTDAIMGNSFDISSFGLALLIVIIMSIFNLVVQRVLFEKD
jgi:putative membrane protein